ncbi:MAG TPA: hypothetical protein VIH57_23700 [Bacteroidales bacterium]
MKKVFSILLIAVVMLSSIHFTVATHFCGGKVAAVKAGLEGTTASCGMENNNANCTVNSGISSADCCTNISHTVSVDNYKVNPVLEIQKIQLILLQAFLAPVLYSLQIQPILSVSSANEGLHHSLLSLTGRLAFICVFRK